jgi:BirA family biotin operon repressor/biotin-[acetyl-CoA-carboxylase] ligase
MWTAFITPCGGGGVNLATESKDFPPEVREGAISLSEHLGRPIRRDAFLLRLLRRLREDYALLTSGKEERLLKEWRIRSSVLGHQVRIGRESGPCSDRPWTWMSRGD